MDSQIIADVDAKDKQPEAKKVKVPEPETPKKTPFCLVNVNEDGMWTMYMNESGDINESAMKFLRHMTKTKNELSESVSFNTVFVSLITGNINKNITINQAMKDIAQWNKDITTDDLRQIMDTKEEWQRFKSHHEDINLRVLNGEAIRMMVISEFH